MVLWPPGAGTGMIAESLADYWGGLFNLPLGVELLMLMTMLLLIVVLLFLAAGYLTPLF